MSYFNYFIIVIFFQKKNNKNLEKKNNSNQININKNDNKNFCNINNNFQNYNFDEKDKRIKNLEENINLLNKQLLEKTNKINTLSKENSELKQKIVELNLLINKKDSLLRNKINELNSKINNQIDPNNSNNHNKMLELYEKIQILQEKLKRFPFILEKNEKLMSIIFSSVDQKIHFSIICKNTDTINKLEAELYREYPQFSETDNYFMCKGKVLNKFHTFESDKIKNGDVIIVKILL